MKLKMSVSVSESLLNQIDKLPRKPSRSAVIEEALKFYLNFIKRRAKDLRDLKILNENAEELNLEANDVLSYQVEP